MIVSASYDVVDASADYSIHDGDVVYTVEGGPVGPPGPGVPTGGSTGDVATKASNADFDIAWQTPAPADRITSGSNELVIDADKIEGNITSTSGGVGQLIINPGDADNALLVLDETAGLAGFAVSCTADSRLWMVAVSDGAVNLLGQGGGQNAGLTVSDDTKRLYFFNSDGERSLIIGSVADNPNALDGSLLLDEVAGPHWCKDGAWIPIGARQSPDGTWWDIAVDNSGNVSAVTL